jgi:hypothetical protein
VEGVDAAFATFHVIAVIDPRGSDMPGGGSPLRPPWGAVGPRAEMTASPKSVKRGFAVSGLPELTPQTPLGRRTAPSRDATSGAGRAPPLPGPPRTPDGGNAAVAAGGGAGAEGASRCRRY